MFRFVSLILLCIIISACTSHTVSQTVTQQVKLPDKTKVITTTDTVRYQALTETSYLERGKQDFVDGYYKRAFRELLPLAVAGNPEAEYAIGYLYYYGYGVNQDTEVGCFWIKRAAAQHFPPALLALDFVNRSTDSQFHLKDTLTK